MSSTRFASLLCESPLKKRDDDVGVLEDRRQKSRKSEPEELMSSDRLSGHGTIVKARRSVIVNTILGCEHGLSWVLA